MFRVVQHGGCDDAFAAELYDYSVETLPISVGPNMYATICVSVMLKENFALVKTLKKNLLF